MPHRNRVLPTGEIVAIPERGTFMGNRGILHDDAGHLGTARWRHPHWVCCLLEFKGRHRKVMQPHAYTELFFLDEAVALAAGHRPCAECRRADWLAFRAAWETANGPVGSAAALDRVLHRARVTRRRAQVRFRAPVAGLPDGTFILLPEGPALVADGAARRFSPAGYGPPQALPGEAVVLTPAPVVAALAAGYRPHLHPGLGGGLCPLALRASPQDICGRGERAGRSGEGPVHVPSLRGEAEATSTAHTRHRGCFVGCASSQ